MTRSQDQRGVGLIEVMVAVLVLGVGLLGLLGLQTRSMQLSRQSFLYNQATIYAQDISERIRANSESVDEYLIDFGESSSADSDDCIDGDCTSTQLAAWDIKIWTDNLGDSLPQGQGAITKLGDQVVITVRFDASNGDDQQPQSVSFTMQI